VQATSVLGRIVSYFISGNLYFLVWFFFLLSYLCADVVNLLHVIFCFWNLRLFRISRCLIEQVLMYVNVTMSAEQTQEPFYNAPMYLVIKPYTVAWSLKSRLF